tara:strand:- start:9 stop:476 length:468 start_codon:yes stop_codon:yes gene_type:complete
MKKVTLLIILTVFISQCGFKVVKFDDLLNFEINKINTSGDNRINYKIKNKLNLFKKTNQQKVIGINIYSEKNKTIKEKNIKNEITKYQLNIKIKIEVLNQNGNKIKEFTVNENGEYLVYKQYSKTLNNEKKLSETLTKKVIDQILDNLINYSNEF